MLHWLYPITCEICGQPGEQVVCPGCMAELPRVEGPLCLYCGSPVHGGQQDPYVCDTCRDKPRTFRFARSVLLRSATAMEMLYKLKYRREEYYADPLALTLAELWESTPELAAHEDWTLVPIPSTRKRLYELGYNHAGSIAKALGRYCRLPVLNALVRNVSADHSQTRLTAHERYLNAIASYALAPAFASGKRPLPPRILLVDDVYTTGSTGRACAKLLASTPGVQDIAFITVIRAT